MLHTRELRVGIIGASPNRGWGTAAHIPAIQALPGFALTAVATTRQESADETAQRFDVPHAFTDPHALVTHPDVDVVAITVKVPEHDALVRTALAAGKHIYCEWPLARDTQEAERLLELAEETGVVHMVGLQARALPIINYVKDLVAQGFVGQVTSCTVTMASPVGAGGTLNQARAYMADRANGANALTVLSGHILDALCYMLGDFAEVSAVVSTQRPEIRIIETGAIITATAPDNVALSGKLRSGAAVAFHFTGGKLNTPGLTLAISGTDGDLVITSDDPLGGLTTGVTLRGARGRASEPVMPELPIPDTYRRVPATMPDGIPFGVAQMYAGLAEAIRTGQPASPSLRDGVKLHRLLDAIQRASDTGIRQVL